MKRRADAGRRTWCWWGISLVSLVILLSGIAGGCSRQNEAAGIPLDIPRGYVQRLEVPTSSGIVSFGPFVGYYFAPLDPDDLSHLRFVCFNERRFYTRDLPANAKLYEGSAERVTLPEVTGFDILKAPPRIRPVFFEDAPQAWKATRPAPQMQYRHFHSCYNATGALRVGYWLRHVATAAFTADMGGRVTAPSPLYHRVSPGPVNNFPAVIEFDNGPADLP